MTAYAQKIASQLSRPVHKVAAVIDLLEAGNTLPFIARYRKEATGGLDEEEIRAIQAGLETAKALDERRATILNAIQEQGKLTPELEARLVAAETRTALEDLYQPYKRKRRTRASMARDKGLQPLADLILAQPAGRASALQLAAPFVSQEVPTAEEALAGARDIVAETISEHPQVRGALRAKALRFATLRATKVPDAEDPRAVYKLYYDYAQRVDRLRPHQVLAINRGEKQKILRVGVDIPERDWRRAIGDAFRFDRRSPMVQQLALAADDAAARLLLPAIERDVRRTLIEQAETHAIRVFADNLRGLLSQPPLAGRTVLAVDPGFRTGCKVAVVDPTGRVLETTAIYPHPPQRRWREALAALAGLVQRHGVTLIAVGNGTAARESEQLVAELIRSRPPDAQDDDAAALHYLVVNEAGASVYSASPLARAELPGLDVSLRSAVSLARRVQDPLAELVKIDPKAIGVGMYQHDVDQKALARALDGVVESVVNRVGVDVNTASPALLTYVAGVGPKLAAAIVAHRDEHGPFPSRAALKKVTGLGPKSFQQAAGLLRVRDGRNPLDASAIHPESYAVARQVLKRAGVALADPVAVREQALDELLAGQPLAELAADLETGEPTLADILEQLVRPGRDPRADLPAPILRSDVLSMDDLTPGLRLNGTVRNVVDFGAFVDIGVKQDGLLHRSQIPAGMVLGVGDVIEVEVLSVEPARGRIGLGML